MSSKPQAGFTLVELMVTLVIVAVLGMLTVPVMEVTLTRVKERDLRHALREIRDALDAYKRASEEGMIEAANDASVYPPNLDVLVEGVSRRDDSKKGKLYFLRRVPRDPMNNEPDMTPSGTWGKRSFASEASDPREGNDIFDIFSVSGKTGLNGIPYRAW
ncbi:MAG: type II secretion system protein [Polaromonas sp.]|nr:type II secretion system protein [Polaromonas sp.]